MDNNYIKMINKSIKNDVSSCIDASYYKGFGVRNGICRQVVEQESIRRLTPLECWRLQSFPDEQLKKAESVCSDTQLYKQAGNSITVAVIQKLIKNILCL